MPDSYCRCRQRIISCHCWTTPFRFLLVILLLISLSFKPTSSSLVLINPTETPPLLNVPVFSLATLNEDGSTNMNIVTYATPVCVRPRLWSIGLYKGTLSHENFMKRGGGVLQLLRHQHSSVVQLLGGASGRKQQQPQKRGNDNDDAAAVFVEVDKAIECDKIGFGWKSLLPSLPATTTTTTSSEEGSQALPLVLPACAHYSKVSMVGMVTGESHDVVTCKVDDMFMEGESNTFEDILMTAQLRDMGIITTQGRVAKPWLADEQ